MRDVSIMLSSNDIYALINYALFQCVMSLIMLSSNDIYALINYASFVESSFIGVSIAGMLYLRYKQPNRERPIKV